MQLFPPKSALLSYFFNIGLRVLVETKQKNERFIFENKLGYLGKNWESSFPKTYCSLHAVDPNDLKFSLLISLAEIEFIGKKFIRHVGHVRYDEQQLDFRPLKNVAVSFQRSSKVEHEIRLTSKTIQMQIKTTHRSNVQFKGPLNGTL